MTSNKTPSPNKLFADYSNKLHATLQAMDWRPLEHMANTLKECQEQKKQVFLCGNGGSAGNAAHIANDFLYGICKQAGEGLRVEALTANTSVLTCLANDIGYDHIYSYQLQSKAQAGDVLIVLSGSGNSANIIEAVNTGNRIGMITYGLLGYDGGKAKNLVKQCLHFNINDMQISEDLQLIACHMVMQWMYHSQQNKECNDVC